MEPSQTQSASPQQGLTHPAGGNPSVPRPAEAIRRGGDGGVNPHSGRRLTRDVGDSAPTTAGPSQPAVPQTSYETTPETTRRGTSSVARPMCFVCGSEFRHQLMRRLDGESNSRLREIAIMHRLDFRGGNDQLVLDEKVHKLCTNCHRRVMKIMEEEAKGNVITMNVVLQKSKLSCILCDSTKDLRDINLNARIKVYVDTEFYIMARSRACSVHFSHDNTLLKAFYNGITGMKRQIVINQNEISQWFSALRLVAKNSSRQKFEEEGNFTDEDFTALTGISKINFQNMYSKLQPLQESTQTRTFNKRDVMLFLTKIRQALSDDFLKVIFEFSSRQAVSMAISTIRKVLMHDFVPKHLGLQALSREDYIQKHVTDFATDLYNPTPEHKVAILTADGTYVYIPKSSNWRVLRQTFSIHKGRHLIKPIMLTAPNGYILDVHGPYFADSKNNDAAILIDHFKKDVNGLKNWLLPGDIMIIDRGY